MSAAAYVTGHPAVAWLVLAGVPYFLWPDGSEDPVDVPASLVEASHEKFGPQRGGPGGVALPDDGTMTGRESLRG